MSEPPFETPQPDSEIPEFYIIPSRSKSTLGQIMSTSALTLSVVFGLAVIALIFAVVRVAYLWANYGF